MKCSLQFKNKEVILFFKTIPLPSALYSYYTSEGKLQIWSSLVEIGGCALKGLCATLSHWRQDFANHCERMCMPWSNKNANALIVVVCDIILCVIWWMWAFHWRLLLFWWHAMTVSSFSMIYSVIVVLSFYCSTAEFVLEIGQVHRTGDCDVSKVLILLLVSQFTS